MPGGLILLQMAIAENHNHFWFHKSILFMSYFFLKKDKFGLVNCYQQTDLKAILEIRKPKNEQFFKIY